MSTPRAEEQDTKATGMNQERRNEAGEEQRAGDMANDQGLAVDEENQESQGQHKDVFEAASGLALPPSHHHFSNFILKLFSCGFSRDTVDLDDTASSVMVTIDLPVLPRVSTSTFQPFAEDTNNALQGVRLGGSSLFDLDPNAMDKRKGKMARSWSWFGGSIRSEE